MSDKSHASVGHVVPLKLLVTIWGSLMVLTVLTVAAAHVDLSRINIWVALGIATVKAILVALYFMHLRYDKPFHAIVFVTAVVFVLLFVGIALTDTLAYRPDLIPGYSPGMGMR
jgi:cytochrome c oxidase subunit 4